MLDLCDRGIVTKDENHNLDNHELTLDDILTQINEYNNMIMDRCLNNSEIRANIGFTWISALSYICKTAKKESREAVDRNCKLWKRINDLNQQMNQELNEDLNDNLKKLQNKNLIKIAKFFKKIFTNEKRFNSYDIFDKQSEHFKKYNLDVLNNSVNTDDLYSEKIHKFIKQFYGNNYL